MAAVPGCTVVGSCARPVRPPATARSAPPIRASTAGKIKRSRGVTVVPPFPLVGRSTARLCTNDAQAPDLFRPGGEILREDEAAAEWSHPAAAMGEPVRRGARPARAAPPRRAHGRAPLRESMPDHGPAQPTTMLTRRPGT